MAAVKSEVSSPVEQQREHTPKKLTPKSSGSLLCGLSKLQKQKKRREEERERQAEEDYVETDLELEEEKGDYDATGRKAYLAYCKNTGIVPISYFLRHMQDSELSLAHRGLAAQGMKALAFPLMNNTFITHLDLEDNCLEGEGGEHVARMLKENCYITDLNLSYNRLGTRGLAAICCVLQTNVTLQNLNLSGNNLKDSDGEHIKEAFLENTRLKFVDLSHNDFGHEPKSSLEDAISENETIEALDLSWNHFRLKSALNICEGIATNSRLRTVNLAMNGLGNEGAFGIANILQQSGTITSINVSNNRIGPTGATVIARALEANHDLLREFKLGYNPLGIDGVKAIFKAVQLEGSLVTLLDFSGIVVDKEFRTMKEEMQENRDISIPHGEVLGDYIIKGPKKKEKFFGVKLEEVTAENLMDVIRAFCEVQELTLHELLTNKRQDKKLTYSEFLGVCSEAGIELSEASEEHMRSLLSTNTASNSRIDFSSLI